MTKQTTRVWFGLFVALVFVAGAGAGVMVAPRLAPVRHVPPRAFEGRPGPGLRGPNGERRRLAPLIARDLGLDADQQQKLSEVFARRRGRLEAIQKNVRQQFEAEQKELRKEIRAILRPDQMEKFDEWLQRAERRRRHPGPDSPDGASRPPQLPPGKF
jgi:Spy/CpxP family protein refolding chaperone